MCFLALLDSLWARSMPDDRVTDMLQEAVVLALQISAIKNRFIRRVLLVSLWQHSYDNDKENAFINSSSKHVLKASSSELGIYYIRCSGF